MISTQENKVQYVLQSPLLDEYDIPFRYWSETEIKAILSIADAPDVPLEYDLDYTVSEPDDHGTLHRVSEWPLDAVRITIYREVPLTQETDYVESGITSMEVLEADLDRAVARVQQIKEQIGRTLYYPISDPDGLEIKLPGVEARKGKFVAFDSNGELVATGAGLEDAAVTPYMQDVLLSPGATEAQAQLDVYSKGEVDDHVNETDPHGATPDATPERLILRDAGGNAKVADPVDDADIATKGWADSLFDKKIEILESDIIVSVGDQSDFATINEALAYLSRFYPVYKPQGINAEIKLSSGFVMEEQVIVTGIDLGWITITSVDPEVEVNKTYITELGKYYSGYPAAFLAEHNAILPTIGALFKHPVKAKTNHCGIVVIYGSKARILPNKGFKNAGARGLTVSNASTVTAREINVNDAGTSGISVTEGSFIDAGKATANNCGADAVTCSYGSIMNIVSGTIKDAVGSNITAASASKVNASMCTVTGAGYCGVISIEASEINAVSSAALGAGHKGFLVIQGSVINASNATGTLSQTKNTLYANGIIYQ